MCARTAAAAANSVRRAEECGNGVFQMPNADWGRSQGRSRKEFTVNGGGAEHRDRAGPDLRDDGGKLAFYEPQFHIQKPSLLLHLSPNLTPTRLQRLRSVIGQNLC